MKISYFEYQLKLIVDWYMEARGQASYLDFNSSNDLSILKVMKLQYFATMINSNSSDDVLLNVFNNYHAMPYGHVESDIYRSINGLNNFEFKDKGLRIKSPETLNDSINKLIIQINSNQGSSVIDQISSSICRLKEINNDFILKSAFDLVEISHELFSWKSIYSIARDFGKYSEKIPNEAVNQDFRHFKSLASC